ncbi:MAG TPA: bifunctional DNA-binding transcriptional regulator/O6-methylguanine-DNA methyltransferase Ada [Levilinea sp.]|nr:bifunctional DNA-binding transcriptional regulator/O6-methylguanine-DNA methyltransferase Ada [Levilinea sp.]
MNQNQTHPTLLDSRWKALVERSSQPGEQFFYAVTTTGVFCRPGCASRLPKHQNVRFFDSLLEASQAGFRPCKRCRPDLPENPDASRAAVLTACAIMDSAETRPTLAELAGAVNLSPFHFQRQFKRITGVTPKQYFMEKRLQRVQSNLRTGNTVTGAIYAAGFSSSAPFYQQAKQSLGMRPTSFKNGGSGARIFYAIRETHLGWLLVAATEAGVCAIEFGDSEQGLEDSLRARFPQAEIIANHPIYRGWVHSILAYLDRSETGLDLPLDIRGTAFQRRVWQALQDIPRGETVSYRELARRVGKPAAARAVAGACASNKIAVAIPCHRVVRSDGSLSGYRWGIERKRKLIELEQKA